MIKNQLQLTHTYGERVRRQGPQKTRAAAEGAMQTKVMANNRGTAALQGLEPSSELQTSRLCLDIAQRVKPSSEAQHPAGQRMRIVWLCCPPKHLVCLVLQQSEDPPGRKICFLILSEEVLAIPSWTSTPAYLTGGNKFWRISGRLWSRSSPRRRHRRAHILSPDLVGQACSC